MVVGNLIISFYYLQGFPISEDYYLSSYSECNWDKAKPAGVCPDSFLAGGAYGLNNSEMLHGQQIDGKFCSRPYIPYPPYYMPFTKLCTFL